MIAKWTNVEFWRPSRMRPLVGALYLLPAPDAANGRSELLGPGQEFGVFAHNKAVFEVGHHSLVVLLPLEQLLALKHFLLLLDLEHLFQIEFAPSEGLLLLVDNLHDGPIESLGDFKVVLFVLPHWRLLGGVLLAFSFKYLLSDGHAHGHWVASREKACLSSDQG